MNLLLIKIYRLTLSYSVSWQFVVIEILLLFLPLYQYIYQYVYQYVYQYIYQYDTVLNQL
jgi:hypothetical protein